MIDPTSTTPHRASAELFAAFQREQRMFGAFMGGAIGVLALAALVSAGTVFVTYTELKKVERQNSELNQQTRAIQTRTESLQTELISQQARFEVVLSDLQRQREDLVARFHTLRLDQNSANRDINRLDRLFEENGNDRRKVAAEAVAYAREHILGNDPLNPGTAEVILWALQDENSVLLSPREKQLIDAARLDWLENRNSRLEALDALMKDPEAAWPAYGAAGLASVRYRDAAEKSFMWEMGCGETVAASDQAIGLGLTVDEAPALWVWRGECLRKHGMPAEAYESFHKARVALGETELTETGAAARDANRYWERIELRTSAVNGEGTTLIALASHGQAAAYSEDPIGEARLLLKRASRLRQLRDATPTGIAYTEEPIGFVYILEGNWDAALAHTGEIDRILPLAWNLAIRYIAADEKIKALGASGDVEQVGPLLVIQADAKRVLSLMPYEWIDEDELVQLLPPRYAPLVAELVSGPRELYMEQNAPQRAPVTP